MRELFSLIYSSESQRPLPQSCNARTELAQLTPAFHWSLPHANVETGEQKHKQVNVIVVDAGLVFVGIFFKDLSSYWETTKKK